MIETSHSEEEILWGYVKLKFEVSKRNFYAMLLFNVVIGFCLSGFELLQQNSLVSPRYFNYTPGIAAQYNSYIVLIDLVTRLLVNSFFVSLADNIGRQKTGFIGFGLTFIALLLSIPQKYPNSSLTRYYFARIIYANGISALLSVPLVADYVEHDTRGKAVGVNNLCVFIGFSVSSFIIYTLSAEHLRLKLTDLSFLLFVIIVGGLACLNLKAGKEYFKLTIDSPDKPLDVVDDDVSAAFQGVNPHELDKKSLLIYMIQTRPWVAITFIFAFINGVSIAILTQILNFYVQSFNVFERVHLASSLIFKANVSAVFTSLILAPTFGYINPIYNMAAVFISYLIGFQSIVNLENPKDYHLVFVSVIMGGSCAISQLLSTNFGFRHYPTVQRNFFFWISNVISTLGIIFITVIGGMFFNVNRNWPFYIGGVCYLASFALLSFIYLKKVLPAQRKLQNKKELNLTLLYTSIQDSDPKDNKLELD